MAKDERPLSLSKPRDRKIFEATGVGNKTIDFSGFTMEDAAKAILDADYPPTWDLMKDQKGSVLSLSDTENVRYYTHSPLNSYSTTVPEIKPPAVIPTPEQQAAYHQRLTEEYVRLHKDVAGIGHHAKGLDMGLIALEKTLEAQRAEASNLAATQAELARLQQETERLIVERLDAIETATKKALNKINDRLDLLDSDVVILNRSTQRDHE